MEVGSENETQDDSTIIRNPTHCNAPITKHEIPNSPFLSAMGCISDVVLHRIRRSTGMVSPAERVPWLIKSLNGRMENLVSSFYSEYLVQEAEVVLKFNNPHIAGALACEGLVACKRQLAMEYCSNTLANLLCALYVCQQGPLKAANAYKVVLAILDALDYLHTKQHIMHGDVKSFNILVDNDFENIKLCGFGPWSKTLTANGTMENVTGRVAIGLWSAPEVLENSGNITSKSDMFSFGLVIFEMIACLPPHTFPGIRDLVIAAPKELKQMRNKVHNLDASNDEEVTGIPLSAIMRKRVVYARKRKSPIMLPEMKRMKYDEVIDLVEEDETAKDESVLQAHDRLVTDIEGKENKPIDNETNLAGKENDAIEKPSAVIKENDSVGKANDAVVNDTKEDAVGIEKTADEQQKTSEAVPTPTINETDDTAPKVDSSTDPSPPSNDTTEGSAATIPKEKSEPELVLVSPEVVTVFDSSDEENFTPIKSYEVNSSDEFDTDTEENSVCYSGEMYDGDDFGTPEDEEGSDMDGNFLNYGCLGTRPPLPSEPALGKEYDKLLEMFFACTTKNHALRPSAAQILQAYQDNKETQP
ncbi:lymphokine-activated killer T-cell-originated protein kinase-like [Anopheles marshallii]|uniref:lymphokine-activated killer T-cell-originated protein kinase-like n=1 Tax=Anopheles marshallii TaxID=1521116 RepID=UPI00237BECEB|nr:lymphokine-activated killer T-cell-originated protein kinase-like [Anopheles marshallii]